MCHFVESIRVENRQFYHLEWHQKRLDETRASFFGSPKPLSLEKTVVIPSNLTEGVYKCRVEYGAAIERITFESYTPKVITSLRAVEDDTIDYPFKFQHREVLDKLRDQKGEADDIIIVKKGCLTDTSFSNIILLRDGDWYTPDTFLLNGTCRQRLLHEGRIKSCRIGLESINDYAQIRLINALLDWETQPAVRLIG